MSIVKSLKLKTGELIAAKMDADFTIADFVEREKYVTLHEPVVYSSFKFLDPESNQIVDTVAMAPLNGITNDKSVVIEASLIMFISDIRDNTLERYERFLSQLAEYNNAGDITLDESADYEPEIPDELADFLLENLPKTTLH